MRLALVLIGEHFYCGQVPESDDAEAEELTLLKPAQLEFLRIPQQDKFGISGFATAAVPAILGVPGLVMKRAAISGMWIGQVAEDGNQSIPPWAAYLLGAKPEKRVKLEK